MLRWISRIGWPLLAAAGLVSACATPSPGEQEADDADWLELGATVHGYSEGERLSRLAVARSAHAANPSSASAIRLAILLTGQDGPNLDVDSVLSLLDYAERNLLDSGAEDLAFIRFFRPVVLRLAALHASLAAETSEKQELQEQLEALKELEEQLNDGDSPR